METEAGYGEAVVTAANVGQAGIGVASIPPFDGGKIPRKGTATGSVMERLH